MQDKRKLAIEVDNVQKIYKLYDKPSDRLKEAFGFGKKTKHKLHYALKGVSMKIYQGETVGIIGTNGSGKSTVLRQTAIICLLAQMGSFVPAAEAHIGPADRVPDATPAGLM